MESVKRRAKTVESLRSSCRQSNGVSWNAESSCQVYNPADCALQSTALSHEQSQRIAAINRRREPLGLHGIFAKILRLMRFICWNREIANLHTTIRLIMKNIKSRVPLVDKESDWRDDRMGDSVTDRGAFDLGQSDCPVSASGERPVERCSMDETDVVI